MKFTDFRKAYQSFIPAFRTSDLHRINFTVIPYQLNLWQKRGFIQKLRNGYYTFSESALPPEFIANFIYAPSYISLETALFYYGILTDVPQSITSVTSLKSAGFSNYYGHFIYRKIKKQAFTGYSIIQKEKLSYTFATLEKALVDYFYLNLHQIKSSLDYFMELRFTEDILLKSADWSAIRKYAALFASKKLDTIVQQFHNYLQHAHA